MTTQGNMVMLTQEELLSKISQACETAAKKAVAEVNAEGLITTIHAAGFLDMPVQTFRKVAKRRDNPAPHRASGKLLRYMKSELLAWHKSL